MLGREPAFVPRDQYRLEANHMVILSRLREGYSGDLAFGWVKG